MTCVHEVYASLFNDRAISYRVHNKFDHSAVALSVGVQHMVRSDLGSAGVMFTLDTESGFRDVVFITAAYGLGETVVQGAVNPDEFYVYKPALRAGRRAVLRKNLGGKALKMVYADPGSKERVRTVEVATADRNRFSLSDADISSLAKQALTIEEHYGAPMDIEWGKDGSTGKIYILQARPETVQSRTGRTISAVYAENPLEVAGERTQHRSAHRRGAGAHHQGREGNVARAGRGRAGGRHDRSGLGTGDETRLRHRHQSRRAHLSCGDHRARTRHTGGRRLRNGHCRHQGWPGGHRVVRRRRYRERVRRHARIRSALHRNGLHAGDPGENHHERRQSRPCFRFCRHTSQGRGPRPSRVHHQPHDRRSSAGAAGIRQAKPRAQGHHHQADRRL